MKLIPVHCWKTMMSTATRVRRRLAGLKKSDLYWATPSLKLLDREPSWSWG